jgi:hypothetical protein
MLKPTRRKLLDLLGAGLIFEIFAGSAMSPSVLLPFAFHCHKTCFFQLIQCTIRGMPIQAEFSKQARFCLNGPSLPEPVKEPKRNTKM